METFTVRQLADQAGVTRRTLHYYDEIGLLKPASVRGNGYRVYDESSLLRLQQIMLYREMGVELDRIREILDNPAFEPVIALQAHRKTLQARVDRLKILIGTVDAAIMYYAGGVEMSRSGMFEGFSDEVQKQHEKEAVERWGDTAAESIRQWYGLSDDRKKAIMQEGSEIYAGIAANMGQGAGSQVVQDLLACWHQHMRNFYEPTLEILAGLGKMYHDHPDFNATFTRIHPDLPTFLKEAIAIYVDRMEIEWLEEALTP